MGNWDKRAPMRPRSVLSKLYYRPNGYMPCVLVTRAHPIDIDEHEHENCRQKWL